MGRFTKAVEDASKLTDQQLATEIANLGALSRADVLQLLPEKRDKETFIQLMHEVESERGEAEKLAFLRDNLETAGRIAMKLLAVLV